MKWLVFFTIFSLFSSSLANCAINDHVMVCSKLLCKMCQYVVYEYNHHNKIVGLIQDVVLDLCGDNKVLCGEFFQVVEQMLTSKDACSRLELC